MCQLSSRGARRSRWCGPIGWIRRPGYRGQCPNRVECSTELPPVLEWSCCDARTTGQPGDSEPSRDGFDMGRCGPHAVTRRELCPRLQGCVSGRCHTNDDSERTREL